MIGDTYITSSVRLGSAGELKLEESVASRIGSLKHTVLARFPMHFFLDWGVTGIDIGDTQ